MNNIMLKKSNKASFFNIIKTLFHFEIVFCIIKWILSGFRENILVFILFKFRFNCRLRY